MVAEINARALQLDGEEQRLHAAAHADVRATIVGKRVLLFKELLRGIEYDDVGVADLLLTGIPIIGQLPRVGIWRPDNSKMAKCSAQELWAGARQSQAAIQDKLQAAKTWTDTDQLLWNITLEEVESGGLEGPLSPDQVTEKVGKLWVASRRFPVAQGEKVRAIDDFSAFGINSAFGASEKVSLKSDEHVLAWARAWAGSAEQDRSLSLTLDSGELWTTDLHEQWTIAEWSSLLGRVADLKSAYKQLARHPAHASFSIIALRAPDGKAAFFRAVSLSVWRDRSGLWFSAVFSRDRRAGGGVVGFGRRGILR